ncbi:MAG TPA: MGMT family protein [Gammaproteobacteria bacterium]|jgi:methylated-DNA-protein-cysteine methyltransferase-like protein
MTDPSATKRARIYTVVSLIPAGKVTTYGQVATLAGIAGQARQVGYALAALDDDNDVPWHRVINARGEISLRPGGGEQRQRRLLEAEGVRFDSRGRVSLERYGWDPEAQPAT